jgi:hypothetical protein
MQYPVPNNTALLPGRNDEGKRVEINSVGGCFYKDEAVVLYGPFTFPYTVKVKEARKAGMPPISREHTKTSVPHVYVYVEKWKRSFSFLESETKPWVNRAEEL